MNMHGPGAVELDATPQAVTFGPGSDATVQVPFAGLGGYLLAKAAAVSNRQAPRDYYDFIYVLLHNDAGGPAQAAAVISRRERALATRYLPTLGHALAMCADPYGVGAQAFAAESIAAGGDPDADMDQLAQDAAGAAWLFREAAARLHLIR